MNKPPLQPSFPKASMALFERAAKVVPGGIYGHASPALTVPGAFPYYAVRAEGCRYWDADGVEYLDFMCGYGPIILGHNHAGVEDAAAHQRRLGDCFNHPAPVMVELAEYMVSLVDFADWAVFGKNGSDMTTWAVQVAREFTGRKKILKASGAYHGKDAWCSPGHGGLIEEDRRHIHNFRWNDLDALESWFKTHGEQAAAVILTPYHHPAFGDSEMPSQEFWPTVRRLCDKHGALLILDDVRAGFRLHGGGSHRFFGFEPDISCYCKAIANGYPISAALGRKEFKAAASRVFLTGSYWNGAVAMSAALACLQTLEKEKAIEKMAAAGEMLRDGLLALASKFNSPLVISGPPSMPSVRLAHDDNFERTQEFCAIAAREGLFFHPHHNWFLSVAHDGAAITESLRRAERAFVSFKSTVS